MFYNSLSSITTVWF